MLTTPVRQEKARLTLDTPRLFLRPLEPKDVTDHYISGLNDPGVNRYLVEVKRNVQTSLSVRDFVQKNLESLSDYLFGLFLKLDRRLIGTVRLSVISPYHFSAGVGTCLFDKGSWGKGYGTEAVRRVKEFAFQDLGLHYLEAGCYEENKGSVELFRKAGFQLAAIYPHKYRLEDRFARVVFLSLTNPDFNPSLLKSHA